MVASRLAELGSFDAAVGAVNRIAAHSPMYAVTLGEVAARAPRDWVNAELEQRLLLEADGRGPGQETSSNLRWLTEPENLEPFLRHAEPSQRSDWREISIARQGELNAYGRALHCARLAPAMPEDRTVIIERFFIHCLARAEGGDAVLDDELEAIAALVPYLDEGQLERCYAIVSEANTSPSRAQAALAIAAQEPERWWKWAIDILDRLDKSHRVPVLALAQNRFLHPGFRAEASKVALRLARHQFLLPDVSGLCVVSYLLEDGDARRDVLIEALEAASRKLQGLEASPWVRLVAAHVCLLSHEQALAVWREGLRVGASLFRQELLQLTLGLRALLRLLAGPSDLEEMEQALSDVGRWWR